MYAHTPNKTRTVSKSATRWTMGVFAVLIVMSESTRSRKSYITENMYAHIPKKKVFEECYEMNNGCVCCSVRDELVNTLGKIIYNWKYLCTQTQKKKQVFEECYEMNNGCICCSVRDELVNTLEKIMTKRHKFDYVLVETTGKNIHVYIYMYTYICICKYIYIYMLVYI